MSSLQLAFTTFVEQALQRLPARGVRFWSARPWGRDKNEGPPLLKTVRLPCAAAQRPKLDTVIDVWLYHEAADEEARLRPEAVSSAWLLACSLTEFVLEATAPPITQHEAIVQTVLRCAPEIAVDVCFRLADWAFHGYDQGHLAPLNPAELMAFMWSTGHCDLPLGHAQLAAPPARWTGVEASAYPDPWWITREAEEDEEEENEEEALLSGAPTRVLDQLLADLRAQESPAMVHDLALVEEDLESKIQRLAGEQDQGAHGVPDWERLCTLKLEYCEKKAPAYNLEIPPDRFASLVFEIAQDHSFAQDCSFDPRALRVLHEGAEHLLREVLARSADDTGTARTLKRGASAMCSPCACEAPKKKQKRLSRAWARAWARE